MEQWEQERRVYIESSYIDHRVSWILLIYTDVLLSSPNVTKTCPLTEAQYQAQVLCLRPNLLIEWCY